MVTDPNDLPINGDDDDGEPTVREVVNTLLGTAEKCTCLLASALFYGLRSSSKPATVADVVRTARTFEEEVMNYFPDDTTSN